MQILPANKVELSEWVSVVVLKKNIVFEESQILFGMMWVYKAFEERLGSSSDETLLALKVLLFGDKPNAEP
jgi:hypothetical protein